MAELSSLAELGAATGNTNTQPAAPVHVQKLDKSGRAYATGKRKNAIARVWVKPGSGKIIVNDKEFATYFARPVLQMILNQPIIASNRAGQYDIVATVVGGGLSGQAASSSARSTARRRPVVPSSSRSAKHFAASDNRKAASGRPFLYLCS